MCASSALASADDAHMIGSNRERKHNKYGQITSKKAAYFKTGNKTGIIILDSLADLFCIVTEF